MVTYIPFNKEREDGSVKVNRYLINIYYIPGTLQSTDTKLKEMLVMIHALRKFSTLCGRKRVNA